MLVLTPAFLLIVGALSAGWWNAEQARKAWEVDAAIADADAAQWREELDGLTADLTSTRQLLEVSEVDVSALEERIDQLSADKAAAENQQAQSEAAAGRLSEVTDAVATAVGRLDACVTGQKLWVETLNNIINTSARYNPAELAAFEANVRQVCDEAQALTERIRQEYQR